MRTSSPHEYAVAALSVPAHTPMFNTAVGVCFLRTVDPYEMIVAFGQPMARWQAIIAEGMMLYSIAEETAR